MSKIIYTRYAFEDILVESGIEFNGHVEIKRQRNHSII